LRRVFCDKVEKHKSTRRDSGKRSRIVTRAWTRYLYTSCADPRWCPGSRSEWSSRRARTRPWTTSPVFLNSASVQDPVADCKAVEVEEARMPSRYPLFILFLSARFIDQFVARSTLVASSRSGQFNGYRPCRKPQLFTSTTRETGRMSRTGYTVQRVSP